MNINPAHSQGSHLHKIEVDGIIVPMDLPSDAIRAALKRHPLPPTTLATRLGLPMSTVSRFVKGETAMTLRTLDTLWPELGLEIRPIRTRRASKPAPKGGK